MSLGDLARECQTDAHAARFGGEEWDEEIRGAADAGAFIRDTDLDGILRRRPRHRHPPSRFEHRVGTVAHQVDQQLLDLIGVRVDGEVRPRLDGHGHARFQSGHAAHDPAEVHRADELRRIRSNRCHA